MEGKMKTFVTITDEDGESTTRSAESLHLAVLLTLTDHRTNYGVSMALHFIRMVAESAYFSDDSSVEEISVLISLSRLATEFIEKHK